MWDSYKKGFLIHLQLEKSLSPNTIEAYALDLDKLIQFLSIQSISIGSNVKIGRNCILMPRTKIHDNCIIDDDTILPPDMVVPPYSRVRGTPGKIVGTIPECWGGEFVEECVQEYLTFVRSLDVG